MCDCQAGPGKPVCVVNTVTTTPSEQLLTNPYLKQLDQSDTWDGADVTNVLTSVTIIVAAGIAVVTDAGGNTFSLTNGVTATWSIDGSISNQLAQISVNAPLVGSNVYIVWTEVA